MENKHVSLIRKDLKAIPEYSFPAYVKKRLFVPGDEKLWIKIQSVSDKYNTFDMQRFRNAFVNDYESIAQRQYYLFKEKQPIGTATAWYADNKKDGPYGLVHWFAIMPEFQGRGLAKPLMSLLLDHMRQLGHVRAKINTNTVRIPAINLYLKFGFRPVIRNSDDYAAWQIVKSAFTTLGLDTHFLIDL